jgi:hypothetical protein
MLSRQPQLLLQQQMVQQQQRLVSQVLMEASGTACCYLMSTGQRWQLQSRWCHLMQCRHLRSLLLSGAAAAAQARLHQPLSPAAAATQALLLMRLSCGTCCGSRLAR